MENKIIERDAYVRAFDILSDFEAKVRPFEFLHKGFPVWLGIRQYICASIVKSLNPNIAADFGSRISGYRGAFSYTRLLVDRAKFINRNLIFNKGRIKDNYLIFSSENCRRAAVDGKSINIFIDPIRMSDKNNKIIGVEGLSLSNFSNQEEMFYTLKQHDLLFLQAASFLCEETRSFFFRMPAKPSNAGLGKIIENSGDIFLGKKFVYKLINDFIIYFEFLSWYWKSVFKITQPKVVVSTDWYSRSHMIMSFLANQMTIPTVETFHGLANRYHPGYVFRDVRLSNIPENAYPRYLTVFGKFFKDLLIEEGTLWQEDRIFDLGYPWLDYALSFLKVDPIALKAKLNIPQGVKILTITSQFTLQESLKNDLLNLKIPEDWIVIIKMHPMEATTYKKNYHAFLDMPRIKFVSDKDISFYELLKISDAHASYFSTTLWEAAAFGVSNYIIEHSTKKLADDLVVLGLAKVSSLQDIFRDNYIPNKEVVSYIFSNLNKNPTQIFIDFLDKIAYNHNTR